MNATQTWTTRILRQRMVALALSAVCLAGVSRAVAEEELEKRASWSAPSAETVKAQIDQWLAGRALDEPTRAKIDALWPPAAGPAAGPETLDRLAATLAAVDERARLLVEACQGQSTGFQPPSFEILADENTSPFVRNNLKLVLARWLTQHGFYDEAIHQIRDLKPEDVVDPASLLFYQSLAHHWLLDKEQCLPAIARLLERKDDIPRRYEMVAELMQADLEPLKTDSLDEVSRLMNDIRRRLQLARAGKKVRKQEDDVIAKLDKMIEELEKQRQQQQQQQQGGGNNPSQPMPDSMPGGGSGPGNVDPKQVGSRSGWGNLPPKERQEALQQIGKDFPSHYREVIEEYFRKLARDGVSD